MCSYIGSSNCLTGSTEYDVGSAEDYVSSVKCHIYVRCRMSSKQYRMSSKQCRNQYHVSNAECHVGSAECHLGNTEYNVGSAECHVGSADYHAGNIFPEIKNDEF